MKKEIEEQKKRKIDQRWQTIKHTRRKEGKGI